MCGPVLIYVQSVLVYEIKTDVRGTPTWRERMRNSNRFLMGLALLSITITGLFGVALLYYLDSTRQQVEIRAIPDHLNVVPCDTGWLIIEIDGVQPVTSPHIQIQANTSVAVDYTYWAQTPLLEVFVYPNTTHIDMCIKIDVMLSWDSVIAQTSALVYVWNWTNSELPMAVERRNVFVEYLALNHPEFGINATTVWDPIYNSAGILVVSHYLFRSAMWEMEVSWHVMIPPYDWVHVYLRHRGDLRPCWAAEIESWNATSRTIQEVTPPEEIYRAR